MVSWGSKPGLLDHDDLKPPGSPDPMQTVPKYALYPIQALPLLFLLPITVAVVLSPAHVDSSLAPWKPQHTESCCFTSKAHGEQRPGPPLKLWACLERGQEVCSMPRGGTPAFAHVPSSAPACSDGISDVEGPLSSRAGPASQSPPPFLTRGAEEL